MRCGAHGMVCTAQCTEREVCPQAGGRAWVPRIAVSLSTPFESTTNLRHKRPTHRRGTWHHAERFCRRDHARNVLARQPKKRMPIVELDVHRHGERVPFQPQRTHLLGLPQPATHSVPVGMAMCSIATNRPKPMAVTTNIDTWHSTHNVARRVGHHNRRKTAFGVRISLG